MKNDRVHSVSRARWPRRIAWMAFGMLLSWPLGAQTDRDVVEQLSAYDLPENPEDAPAPLVPPADEVFGLTDDEMAALEAEAELRDEAGMEALAAADVAVELPTGDELVGLALAYREEGLGALREVPLFTGVAAALDEATDTDGGAACATVVLARFHGAARIIESNGGSGLTDRVAAVLAFETVDDLHLAESLGADWAIEVEEGDVDDPEHADRSVPFHHVPDHGGDPADGTVTIDPHGTDNGATFDPANLPPPTTIDTSIVWITRAQPKRKGWNGRGLAGSVLDAACKRLRAQGGNGDAWIEYTAHPEFTVRYKLCGADGLSEDRFENRSNKLYIMPSGPAMPLRRCRAFTPQCAPQHVQMIAQDILYQRRILGSEGIRMPGHWTVNVHGGNDFQYFDADGLVRQRGIDGRRASAFLGTISLYAPAYHRRGMRNLTFHEYAHPVESAYDSETSFVANGFRTSQWGGRATGFTSSGDWWSQLESIASWMEWAVGPGYPTYFDEGAWIGDARANLFYTAYHPLEYGYLTERFSKSNADRKPCLGCDAMKRYLETLGRSRGYGWLDGFNTRRRFLAKHRAVETRVIRDYHLDLLYTALSGKRRTSSGTFRFLNRSAPSRERQPWPPDLQAVPAAIDGRVGTCKPTAPLRRANAGTLPHTTRVAQVFSCDVKVSPRGAAYFEIDLDPAELPDDLLVRAVGVKLHPDDVVRNAPLHTIGHFRTIPGARIVGNLQIHAVPVKRDAAHDEDFRKSRALHAYENAEADDRFVVTGFAQKHPTANRLMVVLRYPHAFGEWNSQVNATPGPQRVNFMARLVVAGYWKP